MRQSHDRVTTHVAAVTAGLFALRYVACAGNGSSRVIVSADAEMGRRVNILYSPGVENGVLRKPGDTCVISASAPCGLLVTTLGDGSRVPDAVTLKLDRIDEPKSVEAEMPAPRAASAGQVRPSSVGTPVGIRVIGHVQSVGDVAVQGGEMLRGEGGNGRIEGFAIEWPKRPAGVDISYGCAVRGLGRLPDGVVGEFVGTRQQARGINGVSFSLIGKDAAEYELQVEARFSDGTSFGPGPAPVNFVGSTGREILVGLSLSLSKVLGGGAALRRDIAPATSSTSRQARVFRAQKPGILNNSAQS